MEKVTVRDFQSSCRTWYPWIIPSGRSRPPGCEDTQQPWEVTHMERHPSPGHRAHGAAAPQDLQTGIAGETQPGPVGQAAPIFLIQNMEGNKCFLLFEDANCWVGLLESNGQCRCPWMRTCREKMALPGFPSLVRPPAPTALSHKMATGSKEISSAFLGPYLLPACFPTYIFEELKCYLPSPKS